MGAENHHEPGPQGPEQQEWQGQRWEYLVLEVVPADPHRLQIKARRVGERLFASGEIVDPIAKSYNKKFEELERRENLLKLMDKELVPENKLELLKSF